MVRIPFEVQEVYVPGNNSSIKSVLLKYLRSEGNNGNETLTLSRLYCILGNYGNILDMADEAGMIE